MTPEHETKKELEIKHVSEDSQQVAPAPLTVQQLQQLNNTPISSADVWRKIILSPLILRTLPFPDAEPSVEEDSDTEPSAEGAVVPAKPSSPYAVEEGLGLNDFINFGKVSRFFNALVRESIRAQNQMRAFASVLPRFTPLQQSYLGSQRVTNRIERGQLILNTAVADVATNRLPTQVAAAPHHTYRGPSLATRNAAVELGVAPEETRFSWLSDVYNEALRADIPFEDIAGLSTYQVQAMLTTRNVDNVKPLTREDVISVKLGATHIEALKKGMPFASIKMLSELQLKAKIAGFPEEDLQQSWLSERHCELLSSQRFTVEDLRVLSEKQLGALSLGYKRAQIEKLHVVQLTLLLQGFSIEEVRDSISLEWLEKIKDDSNWDSLITQALDRNCTLQELVKLDPVQLGVWVYNNFSFEQIRHPVFLKLSEEYNNSYDLAHLLAPVLELGHSLDDLAGLKIVQLRALGKGYTIEQVKNPAVVAFSEKVGIRFKWVIEKLFKDGVTLKEIADLNVLQLKVLRSDDWNMTLEKVKHPNFSVSVLHAMKVGHSFEDVIDLQPWQHRLLVASVSLEKVKACRHKPHFTLKHVKAVQAGANFDDIESLNYATLKLYLATPCCDLPQQQLLPSRVESKNDHFLPPVVMHAYPGEAARSAPSSCSSTSSSASSSYYAPGGSSSSSSRASSSFDCRGSSSSSSSASSRATTPGSTLMQYAQHQERTTSPSLSLVEPEELLCSSDNEDRADLKPDNLKSKRT